MAASRIRILRVITRLNVGGPTRHVRMLLRGLDATRFEQILVHGVVDRSEEEDLEGFDGERIVIPELRRRPGLLKDGAARRVLRAIVRATAPAILHTHQGKAGALGRLVAHSAQVPAIVHTYHGHTFSGYFGALAGALVRVIERRAARVSHALVCQSATQEADVLRVLGEAARGRTVLIPPAVEPLSLPAGFDRAAFRATLGAGARDTVILLPARLVPIKRPRAAVELVGRLVPGLAAKLWIAGDGPLKGEVLQAARREGIAEHVRVLGTRHDMAALYAAADATLLVSAMEGTPLVFLESMAAGTPVVSTSVGGVADIVGDAAFLFDPAESLDRVASRLARWFGDPAAQEASRTRGRARSANHRPELLLERLGALYLSLLEARAPARPIDSRPIRP